MIAAAQNGEYYCPDAAARRRRLPGQPVQRQPGLPAAAAAPTTCRRAPATRTPGGQSLPFNLAGSTAELDFVRSILGYQTGTDPDGRLRPGRLDAGAAAARDAGDVPMKGPAAAGLAGPLVKLVVFALVTILASYVLISTITNAGYGEQTAYRAAVHRRRRPGRGRRGPHRRRPRRPGGRHRPAPDADRPAGRRGRSSRSDADVPLPAGVQATIRYRNLVGQRYIALTEGDGLRRARPSTRARSSRWRRPSRRWTSPRCSAGSSRCCRRCRRRT